MDTSIPIMFVDDEKDFLKSVHLFLRQKGYQNITLISDSREVLESLKEQSCSIVFLDINMPHLSGIELLEEINKKHPGTTVIILSGNTEISLAVEAMKKGAFDYLVKPLKPEELFISIQTAVKDLILKNENEFLRDSLLKGNLKNPEAFSSIITRNAGMHRIFSYIEAIAPSGLPILITGKTGTGKELIARSIHKLSSPNGPFVALNSAGLDSFVFADTFFGHVKGAFTGADKDRRGLIEEASGGTLFLDEIGHLCAESQNKLLRLLQEGDYYPLGADKTKRSNARIVAATNVNISQETAFRKDLYYRLQSHRVELPPLCKRMEDIPLLIRAFTEDAYNTRCIPFQTLPQELEELLFHADYEGNIRELRSIVFEAVNLQIAGNLSLNHFKKTLRINKEENSNSMQIFQSLPYLPTLKEAEQKLIEEALRWSDGNKAHAARLLGISRQTLFNKLGELKKI